MQRELASSSRPNRKIYSLILVLLVAPAIAGCVAAMPLAGFEAAGPAMRPDVFFAGHTAGWGVLTTRGGRPARRFTVAGEGAMQADGRFRLQQTVSWGDGHSETRQWLMTADGRGGYAATLSDAAGPVRGEVRGNVFHLRYRLRSPAVMMEQFLYLQADGRHVLNTATVTALGVPVAHLSEMITRTDAP